MSDMKIYQKTEHPRAVKGELFSVDVITCDSEGLLNLGVYNYDTDTWIFHIDIPSDYNYDSFVWMYASVSEMKSLLCQ